MTKRTLVVQYSDSISFELRAERKISARLASPDALEVDRVMVVSNNRIPIWIAEIKHFEIQPGGLSSAIVIQLGRVVFLEGHWTEVSQVIMRDDDPVPGKVVLVDADKLMDIGAPVDFTELPPGGALTPTQARARLAWTYGVSDTQVKITISL